MSATITKLRSRPELAWDRYSAAKERAAASGRQEDRNEAERLWRLFMVEFVPAKQRETALALMAIRGA